MRYPILRQIPTERMTTDAFSGYNHNPVIAQGELYDMQNMTSAYYPLLSPRGRRGVYAKPAQRYCCLLSKDALCYLDGQYFIMNEYRIDLSLSFYASATLVSMGAYVIILTRDENGNALESKYVNTADLSQYGDINASYQSSAGVAVQFTLCKADGSAFENIVSSDTAPTQADDKTLWIDTSESPYILKQYSLATDMWSAVTSTYIRISAPGIGRSFSVGDGVQISGITDPSLQDLNGLQIIQASEDDHIVVNGILDTAVTQTTPVTVERSMPNLDFITESGNRLWGCRYGVAKNGQVVNEIYACKLGDFKNWNCFEGISTDSYAVSLGTDGPFTGAITHLGYPLFFKENCLHKIYGNYPANYQVQTTVLRGVQKGSYGSLAIVNEILYYKARGAVVAYDGSLPQEISSALGETAYRSAVAGGHINKYYISMQSSMDGSCHLFVYDTAKRMWHKEDNTRTDAFCSHEGELYYIDHADGKIKTVGGTGTIEETQIPWMVETGLMGTNSPDKKYMSRLNIRMALALNAVVRICAQYDSIGGWEHLGTVQGTSLQAFTLPVRPRRCDHFRLRIEGLGDAKIYAITKTIEGGSDV